MTSGSPILTYRIFCVRVCVCTRHEKKKRTKIKSIFGRDCTVVCRAFVALSARAFLQPDTAIFSLSCLPIILRAVHNNVNDVILT